MRTILVRYKTKPEAAAENERLIGKVFEQLARDKPAGMHYQVFKLSDGVSFVHVSSSLAGKEGNPLTQLEAFKAFAAGVNERCEEPPAVVEMQPIGAYDNMG